MILAVFAPVCAAQKHLSSSMPEIEGSEKRQGLHLACFRRTTFESKENFIARSLKMPAKCEGQANIRAVCVEDTTYA